LITIVSIVFSAIGAFFVYIIGAKYVIEVISLAWNSKGLPSPKMVTVDLLIAIDLFLFGSLLLIFSFGTYDLFICKASSEVERDTTSSGPFWLRIRTVEDLKSLLLGYILIMLSVTFLKQAVSIEYKTPTSLFLFAGGIFLIALSYYFTHRR